MAYEFTPEQLRTVRGYLPVTPPYEDDLNEAYNDLGGLMWPVVLRFLRAHKMRMLFAPATFSISGEYSQSNVANLQAIDGAIAEVEDLAAIEQAEADGGSVSSAVLVRPDPYRC